MGNDKKTNDFTIQYDMGYVSGIQYKGITILQLSFGTVRNKEFIKPIIDILNGKKNKNILDKKIKLILNDS